MQPPIAAPVRFQFKVPDGVSLDVPVTIAVKVSGVPTTAVDAGDAISAIDGAAEAMVMLVAGDEVAAL